MNQFYVRKHEAEDCCGTGKSWHPQPVLGLGTQTNWFGLGNNHVLA